MNRTIYFRGKSIRHKNKWHYGHYSDFNHNPDGWAQMSYWITTPIGGKSDKVYPDTIDQLTEYDDMNEKSIYEEDILKVHMGNDEYELRLVYWHQGDFWTKRIKPNDVNDEAPHMLAYHFTNNEKVEVIGNKHDNPELLKP